LRRRTHHASWEEEGRKSCTLLGLSTPHLFLLSLALSPLASQLANHHAHSLPSQGRRRLSSVCWRRRGGGGRSGKEEGRGQPRRLQPMCHFLHNLIMPSGGRRKKEESFI